MSRYFAWVVAALAIAWSSSSAQAQSTENNFGLIDGMIVFLDSESDSRCGAVNTFNADFFIRSCDRRLVLTTGDDRETPYFVDDNYNVSRSDGAPAGRIRFATDNDGLRQVFWLSDDQFPDGEDLVLNYITATDQLSVATITGQEGQEVFLGPINVSQTQCDPSASFDGDESLLCPSACGAGSTGAMLSLALCLGFASRARIRWRF